MNTRDKKEIERILEERNSYSDYINRTSIEAGRAQRHVQKNLGCAVLPLIGIISIIWYIL